MDRRRFLQVSAGLVGTLPRPGPSFGASDGAGKPGSAGSIRDRICLFTDLLDDFGYPYEDVASLLEQLKIAGPDLTVRPGGLVPPERAVEELPKVAQVFKDHGQSIPMVSTNLISANDPQAGPILRTMSQLGVSYYKLGYFPYGDLRDWERRLSEVQKDLGELANLNAALGLQAGMHNHAGPHVGGAMWDLTHVLGPLNPATVGAYFDPGHATIEGGHLGWKLGFQRLAPRLKMVAIKDVVWEKASEGWRTRWCPLGEGMVRWTEFFSMLAKIPFVGPVSLHIEYDPRGKTKPSRLENSLAAAQKDLEFLRRKLDEAFGKPAT